MTKRQHASTKFQNGEVTDFYMAMTTMVEQQEDEYFALLEIARKHPGCITEQEKQEARDAINQVKADREKALDIYQRIVGKALLQTALEMEAAGLTEIATALRTGNYTLLAL